MGLEFRKRSLLAISLWMVFKAVELDEIILGMKKEEHLSMEPGLETAARGRALTCPLQKHSGAGRAHVSTPLPRPREPPRPHAGGAFQNRIYRVIRFYVEKN